MAPASRPRARREQFTVTTWLRSGILPAILVGFAIRFVVVLLVFRDLPRSDHFEMFGWEEGWIARSLVLGHGFSAPFQPLTGPTALVAPLYPALLAGIFRIFGLYTNAAAFVALGLNAALSALTVVPVYRIAQRTFGRTHPRLAPAAAWLWALYPFAIFYSATYLWDCTLTAFLFAWCFSMALSLRHASALRWAAFGLLYGVTALNNPSILTLFPCLVALAAIQRWADYRRAITPVIMRVIAAGAVLLVVLTPWTVRNLHVMHAAIPMRDGFWLEFYAGNHGETFKSNPPAAHPASNPAEMREYERLGELPYTARKHDLAMQYVSQHPAAFTAVSLRRLVRFWTGFWSLSPTYRASEPMDLPNIPFCTVLTALMLLGTWSIARRSWIAALPFVLVFVVFPLPYYLTHASMDYRQPIEPEVVIMVVAGAAQIATWRSSRRAARVAEAVKTKELVSA